MLLPGVGSHQPQRLQTNHAELEPTLTKPSIPRPAGLATDTPAVEQTTMPPGLRSLMLPVRGGSCQVWAGQHLPAAFADSLPLLVCHGGPGVPSDYLFPLMGILQRPVIFFDQLGCGRSDRPDPAVQEFSIAASVRDLVEVIDALVANDWIPMRDGRPAYHLYGQSFGGILAFETLTAASGPPLPRSLSLSNVPSSVPLLLEDVAALLAAYAPGHPGSHWRGVDVIADWCAPEHSLRSLNSPVLLLAAEYDFVTLRSMQGWQKLAKQHLVVFPGAAHHTLLERPEVYGAHLEAFLQEHEESLTNSG